MKILNLTLKKKWFDMIASGEKKEEYREIKPYWLSRLAVCGGISPIPHGYFCKKASCYSCVTRGEGFVPKEYHVVSANNGYAKGCPNIKWLHKGIRIGKPNPAWCEPEDVEKTVFILEIGYLVEFAPPTPEEAAALERDKTRLLYGLPAKSPLGKDYAQRHTPTTRTRAIPRDTNPTLSINQP